MILLRGLLRRDVCSRLSSASRLISSWHHVNSTPCQSKYRPIVCSQLITARTYSIAQGQIPIQLSQGIRFHISCLSSHSNRLYGTDNFKADSKPNTDEQPEEPSKVAKWTGKNAWKLGMLFIFSWSILAFTYLITVWGPPHVDEDGKRIKDEYDEMMTPVAYVLRTIAYMKELYHSVRAPISDKILPDEAQPPYYQPPYTLVIEPTGVLLKPEWTLKTGWRFKKRPGLEVFLQQLYPHFEVVVYTQEGVMTASPLIEQIDPQFKYIQYRLFRESTRYKGGTHLKDLGCLNRRLSRVIHIDVDPAATQLNKRNALVLKRWDGDEKDRELIDLTAFLRMIAMSRVDDVRTVLDYYSQEDDPMVLFREKHEQLMQHQQRSQEVKKKPSPRSVFGIH